MFLKFKKLIMLLALFLFISQPAILFCDLSEDAYLLSKLLSKSELVVSGYVDNIAINNDNYKFFFIIESVLKGDKIKEAEVISKLKNGFYLEDEPYLEKNKSYLLFLRKVNNDWVITNGIAGVYSIDVKDELTKIISVYDKNQKIFTQNYANDLIDLFNSLNSSKLKRILLYDLKKGITKDHSGFIENIFESNEKSFKIIGIQEAGRLKIEFMKGKIENLIQTNNDVELIFYGICALGEYGDENNLNLITPFLSSNDQGIRRVSIEALGKIGGDQIISPLLKLYGEEKDWGNRIAIITSINRLLDRIKVNDTLNLMLKMESNPLVISILNDTLKK
jgi:hypothetical protein